MFNKFITVQVFKLCTFVIPWKYSGMKFRCELCLYSLNPYLN